VGLASLTYAAMASLPYWLPAFAAGKRKRRRRHTRGPERYADAL